MDDPSTISEAIGSCFDAALFRLSNGPRDFEYGAWRAKYAELDPRVQVSTPWSTVEDVVRGRISIFGG